ncbi:MAG TPA: heme lyase CcmF/NrfE family subunit [Acidobacteriota bacterium]|nr:heme lyase CcmF/NrfE family subunit [Acidobacteriota bacterium]
MIPLFGWLCLVAAFVLSLYGLVAGTLGGVKRNNPLVRSSENAVISVFALILTASVCLLYLILTDRFQVAFVASVSSTSIPLFYKITALWGGQAGSLLFWLLILSALSAVVVAQNRRRHRDMMPWVTVTLQGTLLFFCILLLFTSNPFELLEGIPADGRGLNPLLQNYWMAIHPPILYIGLISVTIPFALSMGTLMAGKLDTSWIPITRRWSLFSWIFLTLGFTLGGVWAYEELGWGGYWAWDPVENASFMPWLGISAFLHSVMITEKKGMLKVWNFTLILLAFELTMFGTFITRSGVVQSVHSFARSSIGVYFVVFLAVSTIFGLFWIAYRSGSLTSEGKLRSFLSREATFLFNNWLFLAICFAVFWGTVFPMVSEAVTGEKITVSAPFFNRVTWPLGALLLVLTGICPLIAWRKASWKNFRRNFLYPVVGGLVSGFASLALGARGFIPLLFFSASGFVAATIFFEFFKGARARQTIRPSNFLVALRDLTFMNKRRYGGFIIHGGVVLVFVGIIASSFFQREEVFTLATGESFSMPPYEFTLEGVEIRQDAEKQEFYGWLRAEKNGHFAGLYSPQIHYHFKQEQQVSEVAINSTLSEDVYVVLSGVDQDAGQVTFRVFHNPMVAFIWAGIGIMVLGGLFVMTRDKKPLSRSRVKERESGVQEAAA